MAEPLATSPLPSPPASRPTRRILPVLAGLAILVTSVLLLGVLELGLRLGFAAKDRLFGPPFPDPRLVAEGYDGADWIGVHLREYEALQAAWHPYFYFRQRPFEGRTIHVDAAGRRQTWRSSETAKASEPVPRIYLLGGSTVWGVGARDEGTIPSALARELNRRGIRAEVVNLAEIGHVGTQQALALQLALRGGERPDLVVAIDGVNDVLAAYQNGVPGWPQNEANRRREFAATRTVTALAVEITRRLLADSALLRLAQAVGARLRTGAGAVATFAPPADTGRSLSQQAAGILAIEAENRAWIRNLGERFGFDCQFYRQPVLFTKRSLRPFEQEERAKYAAFAPLYEAVEEQARAAGEPLCLGPVLDEEPGLVYLDFCHLTESANARLAAAIADAVAAALADRGSRPTRGSDPAPITSR